MVAITWLVIGWIAVFITVIDIQLWIVFGYNGTISGQVYRLSRKYLFVPILISFAFGLACGHFFLPPPCPELYTGNSSKELGTNVVPQPARMEDH